MRIVKREFWYIIVLYSKYSCTWGRNGCCYIQMLAGESEAGGWMDVNGVVTSKVKCEPLMTPRTRIEKSETKLRGSE